MTHESHRFLHEVAFLCCQFKIVLLQATQNYLQMLQPLFFTGCEDQHIIAIVKEISAKALVNFCKGEFLVL